MRNILDKTDQSKVHVCGKSTVVAKAQKYNWPEMVTTPGEFRWVPKWDLNIDGEYQRDEVSKGKTRIIAANWNWLLLGVIDVVERPDGALVVFDGGNRTRASFYRDEINALPCLVHRLADVAKEASAFVGKNTMVSHVSILDRFKAARVAGDSTAIKTAAIAARQGLVFCKNATQRGETKAVGAVWNAVKEDAGTAEAVLGACVKLADDEPLQGMVFRGMFFLCRRIGADIILDKHIGKLAMYGQKGIATRIRQFKVECGKGGEAMEAKAILSLVNKSKRNKIVWPNDNGSI